MPLPDATIPPAIVQPAMAALSLPEEAKPSTGLYGELTQYGKDSMREKTPDGGHIIWKEQETPMGKQWRPLQYVPASNKIEV